jgi:hypothetical protein
MTEMIEVNDGIKMTTNEKSAPRSKTSRPVAVAKDVKEEKKEKKVRF